MKTSYPYITHIRLVWKRVQIYLDVMVYKVRTISGKAHFSFPSVIMMIILWALG